MRYDFFVVSNHHPSICVCWKFWVDTSGSSSVLFTAVNYSDSDFPGCKSADSITRMRFSPIHLIFQLFCTFHIFPAAQENPQVVHTMEDFPQPFTPFNRMLGIILANELNRMDPIMIILNEYKSMCESGWKPTISFFTSENVTESIRLLIRDKLWCYHIESYIPVVWNIRDQLGIQLAHDTRLYFRQEVNNYDVFVYHEDDMIVSHSHIAAYLFETKKLHNLLGEEKSQHYMMGFQRYRRRLRSYEESHKPISEHEILHQEYLIEIPFFKPVCLGGQQQSLGALHRTDPCSQGSLIFTWWEIIMKLLQIHTKPCLS